MGVPMNILFIVVPLALLLGASFVAAFFWAVENGQFEDTETPAYRILENQDLERKNYERIDQIR